MPKYLMIEDKRELLAATKRIIKTFAADQDITMAEALMALVAAGVEHLKAHPELVSRGVIK